MHALRTSPTSTAKHMPNACSYAPLASHMRDATATLVNGLSPSRREVPLHWKLIPGSGPHVPHLCLECEPQVSTNPISVAAMAPSLSDEILSAGTNRLSSNKEIRMFRKDKSRACHALSLHTYQSGEAERSTTLHNDSALALHEIGPQCIFDSNGKHVAIPV